MRSGSETQPSLGTAGEGSPAGAEPQPGLLTPGTGGRRCDLSVLPLGSVRPRPRSGRGRPGLLWKLAAPPLLEQELRMPSFRVPSRQRPQLQVCQSGRVSHCKDSV